MTHAEDLELLHALQVAPRASWRAIGTALHRSPAAIASRWDELSSAGLAWCTAVPVSTAQRGSLIFVAVRGEPGHRQSLIDESIQIPEVISVEEPASHWDLILTVVAPGFDEFVSRIRPKIAGLDGIARLDTIICTRLHFGGHDWRLDALTPRPSRIWNGFITSLAERSSEFATRIALSCPSCSATAEPASVRSPKSWARTRAPSLVDSVVCSPRPR